MRVLCVEDETSLREDMVEYLRMKSYEVDEAATGEDAIEQLNRNRYDLVLCDIKMPLMDGYEVLKQVRSENNLVGTPFIFLSALNERDDKVRAHESGCDGYLTKPIDFSLLDVTLKSYIERQRARDFRYINTLEAAHSQMLMAIDDALSGPISESTQVVEYLREILPVLTPSTLDYHLANLQENVSRHAIALNAVHRALQLQVSNADLAYSHVTIEELVRGAVAECRYYYPSSEVTFEVPEKPLSCEVLVDAELMQRALAGLLAAIPRTTTTRELVSFTIAPAHWVLTISDHRIMADSDEDFIAIDESYNLTSLAPVTRQRLVPLWFAMRVAKAHGGQLEIKLWPGDHLAVRFMMPQPTANAVAV